MEPDPPAEGPPVVVPAGKSKFGIQTLMVWVAVVAAGLGWTLHIGRLTEAVKADQAVFTSWIGDLQASHPKLKLRGSSTKTSSTFFEVGRRCDYEFSALPGRSLSIHADLRTGPLHTKRFVTFESSGRTLTWPFEDVERGRKVDLKVEFPEAFR